MGTILKGMKAREWISVAIIVGLTVLQVWFTMLMVDRMADLIQSITFISYNRDPSLLPDDLCKIYKSFGSWEAFDQP